MKPKNTLTRKISSALPLLRQKHRLVRTQRVTALKLNFENKALIFKKGVMHITPLFVVVVAAVVVVVIVVVVVVVVVVVMMLVAAA